MTMFQIWLDDTKYAIVNEEDYEWALQWRWHPMANSTGKKFYATRMTRDRAAGKHPMGDIGRHAGGAVF